MTILEPAITALKEALGPKGWTSDPEALAPHLKEPRGLYQGRAPLMAKPGTVEEVSRVMKICHDHNVSVVPQGGNTGLVGGGIPNEGGDQILLSLSRLNRIRHRDARDFALTVEAGCILSDIQDAAAEIGMLFPLSLASEGSCEIGGNISTNAGGVAVLRYGNMRELVLGLEVVLPDGRIWNGLRSLRKDNTGYDLKQLFIGAEGTLGVITAATLKLFPGHKDKATAVVAVGSPAAAIDLLGVARARSGDAVTAFELMPRIGIEFVLRHMPDVREPLEAPATWYVLIELSSASENAGIEARLEDILSDGMARDLVTDGVIARSLSQANDLWKLREFMSEAQKPEGGSIKHDISVPVSHIDDFIHQASAAVEAALPGIRTVAFGHVGDGNVHFNLSQPVGANKHDFLARWEDMNRIVHDIVTAMDGSISAEHGIGRMKVDELVHYKAPLEIELMHRVKQAFDPGGIMNPGRVLKG